MPSARPYWAPADDPGNRVRSYRQFRPNPRRHSESRPANRRRVRPPATADSRRLHSGRTGPTTSRRCNSFPNVHTSCRRLPGSAAETRALPPAPVRPNHRHDHGSRVVEIGIMRVRVLKRPAPRTHMRPLVRPVADGPQHLPALEPHETPAHGRKRLVTANLQKRLTHERGVPYRRHAWLTIGFVARYDEQLVDRFSGNDELRMVPRIAQRVEHHHGVRHSGENGPEAAFTIEPFGYKRDGSFDAAPSHASRDQWLHHAQQRVEAGKECE